MASPWKTDRAASASGRANDFAFRIPYDVSGVAYDFERIRTGKAQVGRTRRSRRASLKRRRVSKAEYLLFKAVRKEFKKGGSAHDVFFHPTMKDVVFATRFLNEYLPRKLRDALDLSDPAKLKILSTDYYDRRLKKHIADLVFVAPCKDEDEFVALTLIVEHKARDGAMIDQQTIIQTLKYVVLEVESEFKDAPGDKIVYQPPVVLVYTGDNPNFEAPS